MKLEEFMEKIKKEVNFDLVTYSDRIKELFKNSKYKTSTIFDKIGMTRNRYSKLRIKSLESSEPLDYYTVHKYMYSFDFNRDTFLSESKRHIIDPSQSFFKIGICFIGNILSLSYENKDQFLRAALSHYGLDYDETYEELMKEHPEIFQIHHKYKNRTAFLMIVEALNLPRDLENLWAIFRKNSSIEFIDVSATREQLEGENSTTIKAQTYQSYNPYSDYLMPSYIKNSKFIFQEFVLEFKLEACEGFTDAGWYAIEVTKKGEEPTILPAYIVKADQSNYYYKENETDEVSHVLSKKLTRITHKVTGSAIKHKTSAELNG